MENQTDELTEPSRSIRQALTRAGRFLETAGVETPQLDAEVLLCAVLKSDKTQLYLNAAVELTPDHERRFKESVLRRAAREPVAYITGHKEFWSIDFAVTPDVLIPRPETELLVEVALEYLRHDSRCSDVSARVRILDLGTGSGAIAMALAKELPNSVVWAVDVSAVALDVARMNCHRHQLENRIKFLPGDLFEPIAAGTATFDLIFSNPPYISSEEFPRLAPEIRSWEPMLALDGGEDGLRFYRRIIAQAQNYLGDGGLLLLELGDDLAAAVSEQLDRAEGYSTPSVYRDLAGKQRVIAATTIPHNDRTRPWIRS